MTINPNAVNFPGVQPEQTVSASQTVTITNDGGAPLRVSSVSFGGSEPQDFLISYDNCIGEVAAAASCTLGVSFAPQGQGARSASLVIASNDPNSPASAALSGRGGELPTGPTGPAGQTGANGSPGQIELVVCKKVTKTTTKHGKKHKTTVQHCKARLVSGPVNFVTTSDDLGARVSRAGVTYATGLAIPTGSYRWQLVLTRHLRRLRAGRYTLTLRARHRAHRILERRPITIT